VKKEKLCLILLLCLLIFLIVPAFWRMLKPGIFSMHDFHIFRLFEFHKCISDLIFPCRWAPDSGFGYGEPLFNFYGQFPYILGEPFILAKLSILTTIKILFIFSLLGSAISMFFLTHYLFKSNLAAAISAILYVYTPYRAVDVWVRGALPESLAFVFFPLILLFFNKYVIEEKRKNLLIFSSLLALLVITHNLSFLMFLPFLAVWSIYFLATEKKWFLLKNFIIASFLTIGIAAFYLLPVIFEGKLVSLGKTTQDYYNFRAHFTTLNQLLISRIWGYGASQFGPDDSLSFSVGHLQWILSLLLLVFVAVTKKFKKYFLVILFIALGWFALFLTHGRSLPIWNVAKPVSFIQFPWRYLTMAVLFFAIAEGSVVLFFKNRILRIFVATIIIALAIILNFSYFREDLWFNISDFEQFSGARWQEQIASAVNDFWPKYAEVVPNSQAPRVPVFLEGEGKVVSFNKRSHSVAADIIVSTETAIVQFPTVYFDGWRSADKGTSEIYPSGDFGQITAIIPQGEHLVSLRLTNTPVRTLGNLLSLVSVIIFLVLFLKKSKKFKKNEV